MSTSRREERGDRRQQGSEKQPPGRRLSRRDFIKITAATTAGGYAALSGFAGSTPTAAAGHKRGGGGGGSSSGTPLDPPPGPALADPRPLQVSYSNGVITGSIVARQARLSVGGVSGDFLTYNGLYPGPTISCRRGDKLHLTFTNQLPMGPANLLGHERGETALHTHGWHVSPSDPMDDVMHMFMPGDSYTFRYDLGMQEPGTLCWYHPHVHELTAEQVWGGMHGCLLLEDDVPVFSGYTQHLVVLKDVSVIGGKPAPHDSMMDYMHGKEGDLVTVNGQLNPVVTLQPGEVQRWRILNASNARFYKLQLQGHSLHVVGTDGGLLDKPYAQPYVIMSPGERLDVLVKAGATGLYKLLALPYARRGMMGSEQRTLMTMEVSGSAVSDPVPNVVREGLRRVNVDTAAIPHRTFALSMGQGRGYINGIDFDDPGGPLTVESEMMEGMAMYELWTIQNQSGMDHPWHQHTNPAQVVSIDGGDVAYRTLYTTTPAWKDVVIVPKWGSVTQLVRIEDWTGMAMFHCHILEHEDIGMMGVWNIGMDMPMPM